MEQVDNAQKMTNAAMPAIIDSAPDTSPASPEPVQRQNKSFASLASSGSGSGFGKGKEITETIWYKLFQMKWWYLSILGNILTFFAFSELSSDRGMYLGFGGSTFQESAPVFFEVWMHMTHLLTDHALSDSLAAYFGYLLASKKGYSIVVCGFVQSSVFDKITFGSKLSFRSIARKPLTRLGVLVAIHTSLLLMTMFAPTQISTNTFRIDSGTLSCLEFEQDLDPFDRGWPTVEVEMGGAEYVFGTSLGHLRSQEPVPKTQFVIGPQLLASAQDGSTIFGKGFVETIFTTCECAGTSSPSHLVRAGARADIAASLSANVRTLTGTTGLANSLRLLNDSAIEITSVLTGTSVCGGRNASDPPIPVCKTMFTDIHHAIVEVTYMTDGTPASIATKAVRIREIGQPANMTWMYFGLVSMLGTDSALRLPPTFPGAVNPLLWWTTPNMQVVSAPLLEAGIETTFSMISKGAIQRVFGSSGQTCSQSIFSPTSVLLKITPAGYYAGLVFCIGQLLVNFIALLGFFPWMLSKAPISPAVRLVKDHTYFTVMVSKQETSHLVSSIKPNCDKDYIWPRMDNILRIGEKLSTREDPDQGDITLDRPKFVAPLVNGKVYK
jgi:hypothetical protein